MDLGWKAQNDRVAKSTCSPLQAITRNYGHLTILTITHERVKQRLTPRPCRLNNSRIGVMERPLSRILSFL
jgi:hypothetical protein